MVKKLSLIILLGLGFVSLLVAASPVYAGNDRNGNRGRGDVRGIFQNLFRLRGDGQPIATRPAMKFFKKTRMAIGSGTLTAIDGTTLTVEKDGKSLTVLTGEFEKCTTKFRRRFWGYGSLSEYTVGDKLNVYGFWQDEEKTTIEACIIRDLSIQKRFAVFVGDVVSLTGSGWVMTTFSNKRENQTVTVSASTKFVNRKGETIAQGDIQAGHRVRIKGLWNKINNTVTEVTHVKDFSLPPRVTTTPSVTPTATATPEPTATETPVE